MRKPKAGSIPQPPPARVARPGLPLTIASAIVAAALAAIVLGAVLAGCGGEPPPPIPYVGPPPERSVDCEVGKPCRCWVEDLEVTADCPAPASTDDLGDAVACCFGEVDDG